MSDDLKVYKYHSLRKLAQRIRDDLNSKDYVLIYAFNGTGKTRLSSEFKDLGKRKKNDNIVLKDTLYFNAFTEDLFNWDNDLDEDNERFLKFNSSSIFFSGLDQLEMENKVRFFLNRYADFDFSIDYPNSKILFSRDSITSENGKLKNQKVEKIKISRGEETIFIWCFFLAIVQLVAEGDESYSWVKYIYIDDPISSLDDNNVIAIVCDLVALLNQEQNECKVVISSHHGLFFNILCNELKKNETKQYFLHRLDKDNAYFLQSTIDTPFFHHVAILKELKDASESGKLYTYHFNMLRSILEKTSAFFGYNDFSICIPNKDNETLYARALNLLSHGKYSVYEPKEMLPDTKILFNSILNDFLNNYSFKLPEFGKLIQEEN
ncbi:MAG TPA: AAA family ATPase [Oligoflexia bacterium]|nr:AAA family ATPase [Oligoflexia bacterium]HMP47307.1 AAA family ATPase [Oligoflexia bacterium]